MPNLETTSSRPAYLDQNENQRKYIHTFTLQQNSPHDSAHAHSTLSFLLRAKLADEAGCIKLGGEDDIRVASVASGAVDNVIPSVHRAVWLVRAGRAVD